MVDLYSFMPREGTKPIQLVNEIYVQKTDHDSALAAAQKRIEELTRALEEFSEPRNWVVNGRFDPHSGNFDATSFARALISKQGGEG